MLILLLTLCLLQNAMIQGQGLKSENNVLLKTMPHQKKNFNLLEYFKKGKRNLGFLLKYFHLRDLSTY